MARTRYPARPPAAGPRRSPGIAAFLSFLVPGLGTAWAGQRDRGIRISLPFVALVVIVLLVALVAGGLTGLAGLVVQPSVLLVIVVLDLAYLVYRSWAIVDGFRVARGPRARHGSTAAGGMIVVAVLLAITVATHGAVAYVGWNAYDLVTGVFSAGGGEGPAWDDEVSPEPSPDPSPSPESSPFA
jgi:hypothetical protein